ncbi:venom allergen-1-like [Eurosta solidaginis]|uniref:venom allergen-1-like n=1 Tax=Eurosta solidaginis TaxID=178769 RepID=UPI003531034D
MKLILAILATLAVTCDYASATTNFCDASLCSGAQHIGCNNKGNWASTCTQASLVPLTEDQKDLIVNAHNKYRNSVAGGETKLNAACRMATMQWDEELATLAALNVKQCQMNHDACHNTESFLYSGQNLAWFGFTGTGDNSKLAEQSVDLWYGEIKDTAVSHVAKYPNGYSGPTIGHFTVLAADKNTHVGCAVANYIEKGQTYNSFLMACNYATTNMVNFPIYESCATPASKCTTGTNPSYKNLCSTKESYSVNKWF